MLAFLHDSKRKDSQAHELAATHRMHFAGTDTENEPAREKSAPVRETRKKESFTSTPNKSISKSQTLAAPAAKVYISRKTSQQTVTYAHVHTHTHTHKQKTNKKTLIHKHKLSHPDGVALGCTYLLHDGLQLLLTLQSLPFLLADHITGWHLVVSRARTSTRFTAWSGWLVDEGAGLALPALSTHHHWWGWATHIINEGEQHTSQLMRVSNTHLN